MAHLASCYFGFDTGVYKVACPQFVGGDNQVEKKGRGREEGIREEKERGKKGKGMEGEGKERQAGN